MANKTNKKADISNAQKLGIGVGLTTAAVAAVGAYFLYGSKDAAKNRKHVKSWALKAKGEVLEVMEKAKKMTEDEFGDVVDGVLSTYAKAQKLSKKEIAEFKQEMVENWEDLVKSGVTKVFKTPVVTTEVTQKTALKKGVSKNTQAKAPAKKVASATKAPAKKVAAKKTTK